MRSLNIVAICLMTISLAACADPNMRVSQVQFGSSRTLVSGPNLRLVTERDRRLGDDVLPAQCTEPSPDVAVAFAQSAALSASYSQPNNINASGSASYGSSETALALSGRTAGVLALRDGLYAACQAFSNGAIGHDAYAIILSNYGKLLVALVGGSGGVGAAAPQVTVTAPVPQGGAPAPAAKVADISGAIYAQAPDSPAKPAAPAQPPAQTPPPAPATKATVKTTTPQATAPDWSNCSGLEGIRVAKQSCAAN
jgi:hypothetical protein